MRAIVDRRGLERAAASTSQMSRFETECLASDDNLAALSDLSGMWFDRVHGRRPPKVIALDMNEHYQSQDLRSLRPRPLRSHAGGIRIGNIFRTATVD